MHVAYPTIADLALSTLRLVFVAKQRGVIEPEKEKELVRKQSTKPQQNPAAQSALRAAVMSVFLVSCY